MNAPTYQIIEQIHESDQSLVYRAILQPEELPIIVKILKENYPNLSASTRYKQEYGIIRSLNSDRTIKAYQLQRYQNTLAICLEDFGGKSLKILMSDRQFTIEEFLTIAIEIAEGLAGIHTANIIHKDINPSNIVYNQKTGQLKIIDFGIATRLSEENQTARNLNQLEGTLAYIAPEQTGRMNRGIDYRSDFYSLGVTLYELLTHQLPFPTNDPIELVHCHIAQQPTACQEIIPTIPEAVSNIVMKLLAKTPEERYQTAWGLKADLETCLNQLKTTGQISVFPLGNRDISDKFRIPQKLYGREQEVSQLLTTFERVSQGSTEILMVSGYSGIGKSALINEIHKPIVRQRGYFISGKFDQLQRDIPYAAISQAFQDLIRQLLSEPATKLQAWKERIIEALGLNAQVIIDVIPEVEKIIGKQPQVEQLGSTETQNRFNLIFQKFIGIFSKEHPLVIFLDDLQWADLPSLKFIELLINDPNSEYLLIIGAYRDNEVDITHPLMVTLKKIKNLNSDTNNIKLYPLNIGQVNELIADTLKCSTHNSTSLAELVINKTQGNPFFLNQLLQSLHQANLLSFDRNKRCWQWDIEEIKSIEITDNVIHLMVSKIERLEENTQKVLKTAACIGNRFNLEILSVVNTKSQVDIARDLLSAIQEGLILPLSESYIIPLLLTKEEIAEETSDNFSSAVPKYLELIQYKFLHDRVQQAAYELIPEDEKKAVHLQVGRLLLKNTREDLLEENLFEIVNQLNEGLELITEQSEKDELAKLNLQAGKKAKASTAYESSLRYLESGLKLLAQNSWDLQYELTLELYSEYLEILYLNKKFKQVEELSLIASQQVKSILDKIKIYQARILSYSAQIQQQKAIDVGIKALIELGIDVPQQASQIEKMVAQEQELLNLFLKENQFEDLVNIPKMNDPYKIAAISILQQIIPSLNTTNAQLLSWAMLTQLNLCLKYADPDQSARTYSFYGMVLCGVAKDYNLGYQFGQLSLKLLEQFNLPQIEALVMHLYYGLIWHWQESIRNIVAEEKLLTGFQKGIETGDNVYASYAIISYCLIKLFGGYTLEEIEPLYVQYTKSIQNLQQEYSTNYIKLWHNTILSLFKEKNQSFLVIGSSPTEENKYLDQWIEDSNEWLLFNAYLTKTILYYYFKDYRQACEQAIQAQKYSKTSAAYLPAPQHNFYSSLAFLAEYSNSDIEQQKQLLQKVENNQESMQEWSKYCTENFQHKYALVEAEKARVLGQNWEAQELYEQAIQGAKKSEFIHEEALAYERAAEFYLSLGREEIGQLYLRNAHHCYSRWGAKAKVTALEVEYPQLLVGGSSRTSTQTINTTATGGSGAVLDLTTVIKASQALAGEIVLEKLLAKLMQFAIENAGAQKGYLILVNHNKLTIEAAREVGKNEVTVLQSLEVESTSILPQAIINYALRTQEDVVLDDATHQGLFIADPYIVQNQPKSVLCAPIINQGKLIGLLYLENNLTTDAFTSDRLELLRILSAQAAISIENALLYQTLEQKVEERTAQLAQANTEIIKLNDRLKQENLRMSAELDITRELQQMILPKAWELEQIPGLDIAGFMEPATEVGGDYYDVLNQDGRIKIGIGDVTGHGLESGVVMIMAQTAVRALLANQETNPVRFLNAVNRTIYDNVQRMSANKTLSLALLDYQDGTLRLSGQHEEVILVRADGRLELIDTVDLGFPVGLESDIEPFINELEIVLNPGDGIVLYTDGITEAENTDGNQYGLERLCEVVRQHYNLYATEIQQAIVEDVRAYIGEQEVFDDITLLVLKQK